MAYDKTIFVNYATQQRIKSTGAADTSPLKICYQDYATWRIYFYDVDGTTLTPKDLSLAVAWRAAIDKDFSGATDPMCRALDAAIGKSGLADGYIDVSLDADTSTFLAALTGETNGEKNCHFEVMGFDVTAKRIFYLRFAVTCQNVVDPNTGTPGDPVSNYYVKTEVDALLRAGRDLQYSVDGSTLWHDTQATEDRYWRERYPDGEWSAAIAMVVGPAGEDAPAAQIQYSVDGSTSWHSTFTAGDLYQRVSVDGGSTWSDAMEFVGADGTDGDNGWTPVVAVVSDGARRVLQVSDWAGGEGTKPATGSYVGATGFVANIADAIDIRGSTGATGADGADAPNVQIQYSSDNASFHSPKVSGDVYIRFSTDGGSTWTSGMEFTSSGVNTDIEFDNADLVAGELTVTGTRSIVAVVDNSGKVVYPDEITYGATDTTVDLTSFGTLTGTWKVLFAQGKDGTNGTNGTSFVWKGAYSDATTYAANDAVEYNGSSYMSLQGSNLDKEPGVDTDYWELMAAKGDDTTSTSSDMEVTDSAKGLILKDRTTSTRYRIFIDNGVIGIESVA